MNNIQYQINLLLKDNNVRVKIKDVSASFNVLDNSVNKVNQSINNVTGHIRDNIMQVEATIKEMSSAIESTTYNISNQLNTISLASIAENARNTVSGLKEVSESGIGFEQSLADLSSITGIAGKELESLGKVARETGKDSGLGAKGAVDAFALLASQIQVDKIGMEGLKLLQKETITLAQAAGMGMADAATAMAATINQFGLEATDANRVINVLAAGSKYGAAEINDLAQSFKVTGATASAAGLSVEQTAGALEVLSKSNLKGAESGTALRNIILKLQTGLGMDLGETGLSAALESLKPKLDDVTYLSKLFGMENVAAAQFLITNAVAVDEMTQAVTGTNVAQEQAAIRTNTTAEQIKRMQAVIDDAKISLFNLTGGATAYISVIGDSAVVISQMLPLYSVLKSTLLTVATATGRATIAAVAKTAAEKASIAITYAATTAQAALNAVMSANPIALVVLAISALVAGLTIAYNQSESFRNVVDKAWAGVKKLAAVIWDNLVKAFSWLSQAIGAVWDKLKQLFGITEDNAVKQEELATSTSSLKAANNEAAAAVSLLTSSLNTQNNAINRNLSTLGGIEQKVSDLKKKQKEAALEQAGNIEREIRLWEKKLTAMQNSIRISAADKPEMETIKGGKIELPKSSGIVIPVKVADDDIQAAADRAKAKLQEMADSGKMFSPLLQGLEGVSAMMYNLSGAVGESAAAWLSWGANLMQTIAQAIPKIIALTNTQVAAAATQVTANTSAAASGAAASVASIPIVGWIMAGAAIASVIAALAALPKPRPMATGGIVYGNTFAQVGEYPGAANNPEVVAPLSKLRQLIEPGDSAGGVYEFRLRGRDFVAVAAKYDNINSRTR